MLIHSILFEVGHHVGEAGLSCGLGPLLLYLVHLLQVLLGCRIQLAIEALLRGRLQWTGLGLGDLVDFETAAHGGVHHYFARGLDLLQAVERHIVQVTCAVQISLLVTHDLLEEYISTSFSLLLLQQQVVSRCDLVVLVILNISYSL